MKAFPKNLAYLLLISLITISPKIAHADDASDKAAADNLDEINYQTTKAKLTTFSSVEELKKQGFEFSITGPAGGKMSSDANSGDCPTKLILNVAGPFATFGDGGDQKLVITQDNLQLPAHYKDLAAVDPQMFYFAKDSQGRLLMLNATGTLFLTFAENSVLLQGTDQALAMKAKPGGCILNKDAPAQVSASVADSCKAVKVQDLSSAALQQSVAGAADKQAPAK